MAAAFVWGLRHVGEKRQACRDAGQAASGPSQPMNLAGKKASSAIARGPDFEADLKSACRATVHLIEWPGEVMAVLAARYRADANLLSPDDMALISRSKKFPDAIATKLMWRGTYGANVVMRGWWVAALLTLGMPEPRGGQTIGVGGGPLGKQSYPLMKLS